MWAAAPGHLRRIQWSTRHDRKYLMWTEKYFMLTKNTALSQLSAIFSNRKYLLAEPNCCDHEKYFDCEAKENTPVPWLAWSQRETRCEDSQMMIWHLAVVFSSYGQQPAACGATSYWRETAEIIIRSYSFSLVGQSSGKLSWPLHYKAWLKLGIWYSETSKQTIKMTSYVIWNFLIN